MLRARRLNADGGGLMPAKPNRVGSATRPPDSPTVVGGGSMPLKPSGVGSVTRAVGGPTADGDGLMPIKPSGAGFATRPASPSPIARRQPRSRSRTPGFGDEPVDQPAGNEKRRRHPTRRGAAEKIAGARHCKSRFMTLRMPLMAAKNSVSTAGNPSTVPFQFTMKQNVTGVRPSPPTTICPAKLLVLGPGN
jgi:hypothetical protein